MNTQRPPQRPPQGRPPMTREEYERRRAAYLARKRALARKRRQRIALLALAAAAVVLTIVLTAVAIHRAATAAPDAATTAAPTTTAAPAATTPAPAETTAAPAVTPSMPRKFTVCIDPGHGYDDPGASTKFLGDTTESEVTLAIGLMLRDELIARGFTVIMTHETNDRPADVKPGEQYLFGLKKRTEFANAAAPDFYLSIHGDTYEDPSVHGARVYYQEKTGADNTAIAAIAQTFVDALDRGVPNAPREPLLKAMQDDSAYYVLRNVNMQAVLVEIGFASNATDAKNMLDPAWQKQVALALADGVELNFADEE